MYIPLGFGNNDRLQKAMRRKLVPLIPKRKTSRQITRDLLARDQDFFSVYSAPCFSCVGHYVK